MHLSRQYRKYAPSSKTVGLRFGLLGSARRVCWDGRTEVEDVVVVVGVGDVVVGVGEVVVVGFRGLVGTAGRRKGG